MAAHTAPIRSGELKTAPKVSNHWVYALYGLTEEEIAIVENT